MSDRGALHENKKASKGDISLEGISEQNMVVTEQFNTRSVTAKTLLPGALQTNEICETSKFDSVKQDNRRKPLIQKGLKKAATAVLTRAKKSESKLRSKNLRDNLSYNIDSNQSWEVDLRTLPIILDVRSKEFNEVLNPKQILREFYLTSKTTDKLSANTLEDQKRHRQEARLAVYTSIYDIQSNSRVHYLTQEKMAKEALSPPVGKKVVSYNTIRLSDNR